MMISRRIILASCAAIFAAPVIAQQAAPSPAAPDPLAPVRSYLTQKPDIEKRLFSKRLLGLYNAAVKKSQQVNEPVSGLDFSPAIDGQDNDQALFKRTLKLAAEPGATETAARVRVSFRRFKEEKKDTVVLYTLIREGTAWKIDDIQNLAKGDAGWVYSKLLALGAQGK